jgi:signal transduction histidine kinase
MTGGTSATARRWAWPLGTLAIGLLIAALVLAFVDRNFPPSPNFPTWNLPDVLDLVAGIPVPALGILLAVRRPENRLGWLFIVAGLGIGLGGFTGTWAFHALVAHPGLPGGRLAAWLGGWTWPIAVCTLPFLFLWFPTGRLKSSRWRVVAWLDVVIAVAFSGATLLAATANWNTPLAEEFEAGPVGDLIVNSVFLVGAPLFGVVMVLSVVSALLRFRGSTGDERLQLKWFATAAALVAVTFTISFFVDNPVLAVLGTLALLSLYGAITIAILKYRLYEIEVVIGKTVVFATLVAFITVVYIALVVGVGTLVGDRGSPLLSALAAALVAVAFQPVRQWARRLANRVVYGKRATPYEVLSDFTSRAADTYSTEDVLPRMVRILAEGIGASEARVWLHVGSELRVAASWPSDGDRAPVPSPSPELPAFPEPERAFPVRHGGELLGALTVVTSSGEALGADRERLLGDVAAQTALVLRNVRLIEELRESRRRIVAAQDERAKALERNLHDGAQQQLVALAVKQRLAEGLVERDPERTKAMLAEIQADTQDALETLRDLARGVYPPLLADQGLGAALAAQARKAAIPVMLESDGIGRYPQDVEATVYFCCLEALQNVAKYAEASRATVRLSAADGGLAFEVQDDGVGFDPASAGRGSGLQGMADRLDAVGGSLDVRSAPGAGTTIVGRVPSRSIGSD